MGKKKVLTEDLFNANGNANVSDEVLNENTKEDITDRDDNDEADVKLVETIEEDIQNETNVENHDEEVNVETTFEEKEESIETFVEEAVKTIEETEEIKKDEEISVIKKPISKNIKYGFNDDSYYYENLN